MLKPIVGILFAWILSGITALGEYTPQGLYPEIVTSVFRLECRLEGGGMSYGTAFLISDSGLLITNEHVVRDVLEVTAVQDASVIAGRPSITIPVVGVHASDPRNDLAVLQLDMTQRPAGVEFKHVRLAPNISQLQIGERVVVLGHPLGLQAANYSEGSLNAIENSPLRLRFSAQISRGSSGSPVFSLQDGKVIGVVTSYLGGGQNLNYGTPVDYLHDLLRSVPEGSVPQEFALASSNGYGWILNLIVSFVFIGALFYLIRRLARNAA